MGDLAEVLRYAGTLYQRAFLALAATLYAITTAFSPNLEGYVYCTGGKLPNNIILPQHQGFVLAVLFAADATALWWRIWDTTPRIVWGTIVNFYTAVLWLTVTVAGLFVYDGVWSANVGEIMLTLTSLWVLTRTDYNARDKGTA